MKGWQLPARLCPRCQNLEGRTHTEAPRFLGVFSHFCRDPAAVHPTCWWPWASGGGGGEGVRVSPLLWRFCRQTCTQGPSSALFPTPAPDWAHEPREPHCCAAEAHAPILTGEEEGLS